MTAALFVIKLFGPGQPKKGYTTPKDEDEQKLKDEEEEKVYITYSVYTSQTIRVRSVSLTICIITKMMSQVGVFL